MHILKTLKALIAAIAVLKHFFKKAPQTRDLKNEMGLKSAKLTNVCLDLTDLYT